MYTSKDIELFEQKGISSEQVDNQLNNFVKGFPFLRLYDSAKVGKGIMKLTTEDEINYLGAWDGYLLSEGTIVKFVPASGAASRMFKNMFEFMNADYDKPQTKFECKFFDDITKFAFYDDLEAACIKSYSKGISQLIAENKYKDIVSALLTDNGLNYGSLPKALLKFHSYDTGNRTSLCEHLAEGAQYAANKQGKVRIHFTVSKEHRALVEDLLKNVIPNYEKKYGVRYSISLSEQKPSTDTVAATMDNKPYRDGDKILFRPGGHGALIENLNDVEADVIFIKNIDNVVPESLRTETIRYKKIIGGILISVQKQISAYMRKLNSGRYNIEDVRDIIHFMHDVLNIRNAEIKNLEDSELVLYLKNKLNRPIRVCGMVKNEGEPGGGPFLAYCNDGTSSPQILESSQIDMSNSEAKKMFEEGTHFNPVDLVCYVRDVEGKKFDLTKFVDKQTGFISYKSKNGVEIKALELPGLWNGAMSDWNTIFVEVPIETFNPVKTVNDLLKPQHQK